MKKVSIALFCGLLFAVGAKAQHANTNAPMTHPPQPAAAPAPQVPDERAGSFKFKKETHDFGEVPEGPKAECDFEFKNVGKEPIVITEAHGSCGCTVPSWPKEPIKPHHKGVIHVTYNTQGRVGMINKDVYITSNAKQNPMKLHITGTVKPSPAPPPPPPPPPPAK